MASELSTGTSTHLERLTWLQVARMFGAALLGSASGNSLVYILAGVLGVDWSFSVPQTGAPITLATVITASLVGVGAGFVVLMLLNTIVRRPVPWFTWTAALTLLLSLVSPLGINAAPSGMVPALMVMHVVAGLAVILTVRLMRSR